MKVDSYMVAAEDWDGLESTLSCSHVYEPLDAAPWASNHGGLAKNDQSTKWNLSPN